MINRRYGEYVGKALIGLVTYIVIIIEVVYTVLKIFNSDILYQSELGGLLGNSLTLTNISPYIIIQSALMSPFVRGGLGLFTVLVLIALTNILAVTYSYKLARAKDLGLSIALPLAILVVLNPYMINSLVSPWLPQSIAAALGVVLYYYLDMGNTVVGTTVSILLSLLGPYSSLLAVLMPITHGIINRRFNEASYYALTVGLVSLVYYYIANASPISITAAVTTQYLLNHLIENLASTAFLQLSFLDTGIVAIVSSLISNVSAGFILPPILIVTMIEVIRRLRESKLAWLALVVSLIISLFLTTVSPMWPVLRGVGPIGSNWIPLSNNDAVVYGLVNLAPRGLISTPPWASVASLLLKPGTEVSGYVTGLGMEKGTYAVCGDYELIINNYTGITKVNGLSLRISPSEVIINTSNYVVRNGLLTILSGAYQQSFSIISSPIELPPGRYLVSTVLGVVSGITYYNITRLSVFTTPSSSGVLPIATSSTVSFTLHLNETVFLMRIILYGVSYTNTESLITLRLIRNGIVIYSGNSTAPPISSGVSKHPIVFTVDKLLPGGSYYVEFTSNQPLILYVSTARNSSMNITSEGLTISYPDESPSYALIYLINTTGIINSTVLHVTLNALNHEMGMYINKAGNYILSAAINTYQWVNTSITLLITQSTPVLPYNITLSPIVIKSLEPSKCPIPPMTYVAMDPAGTMRYLLMWFPIPIILSIAPWSEISNRIKNLRRYLLILSILLMTLFYLVWVLGFLNIVPSLYSPAVLRAFGVLFLIGLALLVLFATTSPRGH